MSDLHPLAAYRDKRRFDSTPEPEATLAASAGTSFVIQKHWASHLHYDFRLELDGTMKSWAVPKGPSLDPKVKRMAVQVEDHPVAYNSFEGEIPANQYGAGKVVIWDRGTWEAVGDPVAGYRDGNLKFILKGQKLQGKWALIRMKGEGEQTRPWLLIKEKDGFMRPETEFIVTDALPDSVAIPGAVRNTATATAKVTVTVTATANITTTTSPVRHMRKSTRAASRLATEMPAAAIAAGLPATLAPQLATLVTAAPADRADWLYELKFDGYRLLARIDGDDILLVTRNGNDWTAKMPHLVAAIAKLKLPASWLDGEIVVMNGAGIPDFQALQNAFDGAATDAIAYYVFDLPFHAGHDLRQAPLRQRRALLDALIGGETEGPVRFSQAFDLPPEDLLASSCQLGLEGVIGKRSDSPYVSRRSSDWIKLKCHLRQEFVIGGYTDPKGARGGFGSLLLGVHDAAGKLRYAGNVGTGFNETMLKALHATLVAVGADDSPFANKTGLERTAHWVEPTLLAEVAFAGWTGSGRLRHAVFQGMRNDKPAVGIIREQPPLPGATATAEVPAKSAARKSAVISTTGSAPIISTARSNGRALPPTLRLTHPDKILDAASGTTKHDLAAYYNEVAPLIMPHLQDRPTALVRAPEGVGGPLFFQKHAEGAAMNGITLLEPALDPGHAPLLSVAGLDGLLAASQMNVLEYHTWNAVASAIGKPDRMTFDLDPGDGVAWCTVQESAILVRALLTHLGLTSFLKTSGGKGLHVVVPLHRQHGWETVKDFSHAIVVHLAATIPQRFVAKSGPANRIGKLFVDYLRNGYGATTACAWSTRARPGIGISVPVHWDELESITSGAHWTIGNIRKRLAVGNLPWHDYVGQTQRLGAAMKMLGFAPRKEPRKKPRKEAKRAVLRR